MCTPALTPAPFYRTIEHLIADAPDYRDSEGTLCNYSLGERLFIHLDRATTSADFEQRFPKPVPDDAESAV